MKKYLVPFSVVAVAVLVGVKFAAKLRPYIAKVPVIGGLFA